jgi:hypothetical protein
MSVIHTDLRIYPVAPARRISVEPASGIVATDVQTALEELQGEIITGSATPAAIVPTAVNFAMSPYTVLATDYLLEVDTTGGAVVIQTAASASRSNKPFTVKDIAGNAAVNAISVLRTGAETIDGMTSYPIDSAYDAKTFKPKLAGNGYEVES